MKNAGLVSFYIEFLFYQQKKKFYGCSRISKRNIYEDNYEEGQI